MMKTISAKLDEETKSRMEIYCSLCGKGRARIKKFTGLCDLQEKNGLDIGNNYRNRMKCKEFLSREG